MARISRSAGGENLVEIGNADGVINTREETNTAWIL
jgi:hypothetical protein